MRQSFRRGGFLPGWRWSTPRGGGHTTRMLLWCHRALGLVRTVWSVPTKQDIFSIICGKQLKRITLHKSQQRANLVCHHIKDNQEKVKYYQVINSVPAFFLLLFVFFRVSSPIFTILLLLLWLLLVFVFVFVLLPHHRNVQWDWRRRTGGSGPLLLTVASFWRPDWKRTKYLFNEEIFVLCMYAVTSLQCFN